MDNIKLDLPSNPKYIQMLRLSTLSLANKAGFDIETSEDLQVVVSEIFTYLITDNDRINVSFNLYDDKINIDFSREKTEKEEGLNDASFELKKQILLHLTDELLLEDDKITVLVNKK